ncbi:outer membrane protein [Labrys sp. KNU-23]|uniref:outer membrane protein n=1 Tax=Labrys sp. KNU-23 TaxID=2789216 RepID=UPI00165B1860|nr:outer membrane protein [Labrys sp. KNU-23]
MKLRISASAFLLVTVGASAADLAPAAVEPVAPAAAYNWTGFYAGINGGDGFGSSHDVTMSELFPATGPLVDRYGSLSPKGGFGGVQAGYNRQAGNLVLGLEGDIQGGGISDKAGRIGANAGYFLSTKSQVNWFGTVRPRIGYAFDNILFYATGGLAVGGVKYTQNYVNGDFLAHPRTSKTRVGFAVGGGAEYAFSQHWTAKLEYQYIDLGRSKISATEINGGEPTDYTIHTRLRTDFHTVRLGVNYKF